MKLTALRGDDRRRFGTLISQDPSQKSPGDSEALRGRGSRKKPRARASDAVKTMPSASAPSDDLVQGRTDRRLPVFMASWSLVVAGWVGMAESSAVIKGATAAQYSPGSVFGFGQLTGLLHVPSDVFHSWAFASGTVKRLPDWLTSYLIFDLLFMTGYLVLGMLSLRVLRHWYEEALSAGSQDEDASWERVDRAGRWLLALVFGVNLVQALCALFYARWIAIGKATPPAIAVTIHILAAGKWVLGIALVVSL